MMNALRREYGNYCCHMAAAGMKALSYFDWIEKALDTQVVEVEVQYRGKVSVRVPWGATDARFLAEQFALSRLELTCAHEDTPGKDPKGLEAYLSKHPDCKDAKQVWDACVSKVSGEWRLWEVSGGPGFD